MSLFMTSTFSLLINAKIIAQKTGKIEFRNSEYLAPYSRKTGIFPSCAWSARELQKNVSVNCRHSVKQKLTLLDVAAIEQKVW